MVPITSKSKGGESTVAPRYPVFKFIFALSEAEIFLFMFNCTQKIARNIAWIEVSINHIYNDFFSKIARPYSKKTSILCSLKNS